MSQSATVSYCFSRGLTLSRFLFLPCWILRSYDCLRCCALSFRASGACIPAMLGQLFPEAEGLPQGFQLFFYFFPSFSGCSYCTMHVQARSSCGISLALQYQLCHIFDSLYTLFQHFFFYEKPKISRLFTNGRKAFFFNEIVTYMLSHLYEALSAEFISVLLLGTTA